MSVSTADKKFTINFTEAKKRKFCLSMHYNGHISYLFVIAKKKSISLKLITKMSTFFLNFVWKIYLKVLAISNLNKYLLKKNLYDFSVVYEIIVKSDVLNIHKYLMVKNNTKYCLDLLRKCFLHY